MVRRALEGLRERLGEPELDDPPVIRWDVATATATLSFGMAREEGDWVVTEGVPTAPTVMIGLTAVDLFRLATGRMDGMDAFLAGRVRLSGDLLVARALLSARPGGPAPDGRLDP
jgi:hypothetical protein